MEPNGNLPEPPGTARNQTGTTRNLAETTRKPHINYPELAGTLTENQNNKNK